MLLPRRANNRYFVQSFYLFEVVSVQTRCRLDHIIYTDLIVLHTIFKRKKYFCFIQYFFFVFIACKVTFFLFFGYLLLTIYIIRDIKKLKACVCLFLLYFKRGRRDEEKIHHIVNESVVAQQCIYIFVLQSVLLRN